MSFPMTAPMDSLPLGGETVSVVSFTESGTPNTLGEVTSTPSTVNVAGCRHRPLSASETPVELVDIATQLWQTHCPPVPAVMLKTDTNPGGLTPTSRLVVNGVSYEVVGEPQLFTQDDGTPYFVKLLCKKESG